MPNIGLPELMVIVMILLVVFGASRLPKLGENLGRAAGKLKRGVTPGSSPPPGVEGGDGSSGSSGSSGSAQDAEIID